MPTLRVTGGAVTEGGNVGSGIPFELSLSTPATETVTVPVRARAGTAIEGFDFAGGVQIVTFEPGEQTKTVTIGGSGGFGDERDEAVVLEVYTPEGADLPGNLPQISATGWILDDDGSDENLAIYTSDPVVREGDSGRSNVGFSFSLSRPAPDDLEIPYSVVGGSATLGADVVAESGTIFIPRGSDSAALNVEIRGDTRVEGHETFNVILDLPAAVFDGGGGRATILDDDGPAAAGPAVIPLSSTIGEGGNVAATFNFAIALSEPATETVTVTWRARGGSGIDGSDFNAETGTVAFLPGETLKAVPVRGGGGFGGETDEDVIFEIVSAEGAALPGDLPLVAARGIQIDDDNNEGRDAQRLLSVSDPVVTEGDAGTTTIGFDLALSQSNLTEDIALDWQLVGGTAEAGEDFTAASGTVTFLRGQTTAGLTAEIRGDTLPEAHETFALVFSDPGPQIAAISGGLVTLLDDDGAGGLPVVRAVGERVIEGGNVGNGVTFTVSLSAPSEETVRVPFRAVGGNALPAQDFNAIDGVLEFAPGETEQTVVVPGRGGFGAESGESVILEITTPEGAVLPGGVPVLATPGFIMDDDGDAQLTLDVSEPVVREGDAGLTDVGFTLSLSFPAPEALEIPFEVLAGSASAGSDVVEASGTVRFAEGQRVAGVVAQIRGDRAVEGNESFRLSLDLPEGIDAGTGGLATILDDDAGAPVISLSADRVFEGGNVGTTLVFHASLSEPSETEITVDFRAFGGSAEAGADVAETSGTLTFAPGQTSLPIDVGTGGGFGAENDETVIVELSNPSGAVLPGGRPTAVASGFIVDDDRGSNPGLALAISSPTLVEGDDGRTGLGFDIALSGAAPEDIEIDWRLIEGTAEAGQDFVAASGSLTLRRGEEAASILAEVIGDLDEEGLETFRLALTLPETVTAGASGGTATILDDDRVIRGTAAGEVLFGTEEAEAIFARGGDDRIEALGGDDILRGGPGDDALFGGAGFDTADWSDATAAISIDVRRGIFRDGHGGTDTVTGVERYRGSAFDDRIVGPAGAGTIEGGVGLDRITTFDGEDSVSGGADRDVVKTAGGDDTIDLGAGDDVVLSGTGDDIVFGGAGDDVVKTSDGADLIEGGADDDTVLSGNDDDTIFGGDGDDVLKPGRGNDVIDAGAGDDIIAGFRGAETLIGGEGNDTLLGNLDDDVLDGGVGDDRFSMGPGLDTLLYRTADFGNDRVIDFRVGSDRIDFSQAAGIDGLEDLSIRFIAGNTLIEAGSASIVLGGVDNLIGNEEDVFIF